MAEENVKFDYIESVKQKGKRIIQTIVLVNLLFLLTGFITLIGLDALDARVVINLVLSLFIFAMLYFGRRWAKWLFIIITIVYLFAQVGTLLNTAYELNREYSYPITDEIRANVPDQVTDEWLAKYLSPYPEQMSDEMLEIVLSQIPEDIVMPDPVSKGFIAYVFIFGILEIIVAGASIILLIFNNAVNEFLFWQRSNIEQRVNF